MNILNFVVNIFKIISGWAWWQSHLLPALGHKVLSRESVMITVNTVAAVINP